MLKAKLKAFSFHLIFTLIIGFFSAFFIFVYWYPQHYLSMFSGLELFRLILLIELVLGPLMSLVIYNPDKSRRELILDYALVSIFQLSALSYGVYTTYSTRPVFEVVVKDRVELVAASELSVLVTNNALEDIRVPKFGPQLICVEEPNDSTTLLMLLDSALQGKDIQYFPEFYRDCTPEDFEQRMLSLNTFPGQAYDIADGWLPVFFSGQEYVAWWQKGSSRLTAIEVWNGPSLFD